MNNAIEQLLDEFDFVKVQGIFALRGWSYFNSPEPPSLQILRDTASSVCYDAIKSAGKNNGVGVVECGRFIATYYKHDGELELRFVAESGTVYV